MPSAFKESLFDAKAMFSQSWHLTQIKASVWKGFLIYVFYLNTC